jgi:hypothetical protein
MVVMRLGAFVALMLFTSVAQGEQYMPKCAVRSLPPHLKKIVNPVRSNASNRASWTRCAHQTIQPAFAPIFS